MLPVCAEYVQYQCNNNKNIYNNNNIYNIYKISLLEK